MNEIVLSQQAIELANVLSGGMVLDRPAVNKLLRKLATLDSGVSGCATMQAQLRAMLARKDWLRISISANAATVRTLGISIGIVESKPTPARRGLTPMQKWQRRNGLDRRS